MVDQEARSKYAQLVRQFISGRMTNDEYEERYEAIQHDGTDAAISAIYYQVSLSYDDDETYRMTEAHRLNREGHRFVARGVLFLQSSEEYQWPLNRWGCAVFLATPFLVVLVLTLLPETALITRTVSAGILVLAWVGFEHWQTRQQEKAGDKEA